MLVPAAFQALANQLAAGLDHGPNNFSVALSASGAEPSTHFACRAQAQQSFIDMLTAAGGGTLPEIEGMTPQEVGTVLMQLQADVSVGSDGYAHFNQVIAAAGLKRVEAAAL